MSFGGVQVSDTDLGSVGRPVPVNFAEGHRLRAQQHAERRPVPGCVLSRNPLFRPAIGQILIMEPWYPCPGTNGVRSRRRS